MEEPTISAMMEAYSLDAVDYAKSHFDITLDFTESSVEKVELIVSKLYDSIHRSFLSKLFYDSPSDDEIETISKVLGAYIGEVFIQEHGGVWGYNEQLLTLGIQSGDNWLFPCTKVFKRLTKGEEDSLICFYEIAKKQSWGS